MALTVVPELWAAWVIAAMQNQNNILNEGLVLLDTNSEISKGDHFRRVPRLKSLDSIGDDDVRVTKTTTIVPNALSDQEEIGVVLHYGNGISETDLDKMARGQSALQALTPQIAQRILKQQQKRLAAVTTGCFTTALVASHSLDVSGDGTGLINAAAILDAEQLLGESKVLLNTITMHSKVQNDLVKEGLIVYVAASAFGDQIVTTGTIPTFMGKRVKINDTLCAPYVEETVTKYPSYITGGQPWYVGVQKAMRIESQRKADVGGGTDELYWYVDYQPHLIGMSWNENIPNPTDAQLKTGANWTKIAEDHELTIIRLVTK